ncbi:hypothetical protein RUM44_009881 [Polyplax serrata]|uniref:Homeobox domain-containing protein n=1 Tax=Polyplax serrata TaxID=468196 RepID=A0ABR1ATY3_POLSC
MLGIRPLATHLYSAGYDLAARRKNATRESTATLKAWLNEHKKNPYPTKGEKIMLAIITKMTLTQVSTWFANARRRLKKENKMTWEPKNKTDDDDDAIVSDSEDKDKDDLSYDVDKVKDRLRDDKESLHHVKIENRHEKDLDDEDETDEEDRKPDSLSLTHHHLHHHNHMHHSMLGGLKEEMKIQDCGIPIPATKPKIWSLADTAACKTPPPQQQQQHQQQHWLMPNSNCSGSPMVGMNSFALPSPTSSSSPYSRYGGFLGHYNGNNHSTMGNYNPPSGFPEVQTDTPPQTPPNLKLPSVANNIINSNSCFGGSNNSTIHHSQQAQSTSYQHNGFVNNFNRTPNNQLSPHKERQDYPQQQQQQQQQQTLRPTANHQHQHSVNPNEGTAFKPFFKKSHPSVAFKRELRSTIFAAFEQWLRVSGVRENSQDE